MKEIILDCFKVSESCLAISLDRNLLLNDPKSQEFSVLVFNHSSADCQLETKVRSQEEIDLAKFLKQPTESPIIAAGQSKKYLFDFDFLSLAMEHREFIAKFDLVFDFNCTEVAKKAVTSPATTTQGSVLAANNSLAPVQAASASPAVTNQQFWFSAFFYFLSSLFILVFFVIIKVVNGKKRKSQG